MAIHVQCESSGGMAEIFLHGFNVITTFDTGNCVCVAQVVKAGSLRAYFFTMRLKQSYPVR